jgi:aspartate/tyrosine/aromatic aminotransferase
VEVLEDDALRADWLAELAEMRGRIRAMRDALVEGLAARGVKQDFSFIRTQRGMFSFSGLNADAVKWLRENRSIYIVGSGRINVAGLTPENVDYVCDAIAEVLSLQG